ncbi:hypothetical protein Q5691_00835 [Microcoleus sp. w1-18aA5]|uniref:hypothetical protein n=1 Tax=Microcoleus sp. w1-18aA5 TaxID=2818982 RepID=UPI002FCEF0DC
MEKTQTNMEKTQTNMEATLWHELDEKTSATISGGAQVEGCLAWSIRFGDVTRTPRSSETIIDGLLLLGFRSAS